jgi:UDP-N-acetyl-2-amino-2-deoxyglucuronate dehydrogenase
MLRFMVAGYGGAGERLARRIARHPECRLVSVADSDPQALARALSLFQVSTFPHLGQALAATQADVAVIATPSGVRYTHAVAALESGLDVLLLKGKTADIAQLANLAKARGKKLAVIDPDEPDPLAQLG